MILKDEDYCSIESLVEEFDRTADEINASADEPWEQVLISKGFTAFDPSCDHTVYEVIQRADRLMYGNKWDRKAAAVKKFFEERKVRLCIFRFSLVLGFHSL